MSASGLPGSRVDARRAGMTISGIMAASVLSPDLPEIIRDILPRGGRRAAAGAPAGPWRRTLSPRWREENREIPPPAAASSPLDRGWRSRYIPPPRAGLLGVSRWLRWK